MAEQQPSSEFVAVTADDIIENRRFEWQRFTKFTTYAIVAVVALLLLLLIFVA